MKQYKVLRSLNNNVVLVERETKLYIIISKGIGFKKQPGDYIDKPKQSHSYLLRDETNLTAYEKVLLNTREQILFATEKAILFSERQLNHKFNESFHLSLLDHLNFAIYRHENNLKVGSFFSEEYKYMYPHLYEIASKMVEIINNELRIELPEEEISAVVLHLHASLRQESVSERAYYNQIIQDALDFISSNLDEDLINNKLSAVRLVTHLRFALERERKGEKLDPKMSLIVQKYYKDSYRLAEQLCSHLNECYNIELPREEISYLALHIENIKTNNKEDKLCLKNYKE